MQVDGIISEYKEQGQRGARIRSRPSSHTLRWINRTRPCSRRNQLKFPSQIKDSHELSTQHLAQANTCPGLFEMRVVSSHTAAPSIECDSGHRLCFSLRGSRTARIPHLTPTQASVLPLRCTWEKHFGQEDTLEVQPQVT